MQFAEALSKNGIISSKEKQTLQKTHISCLPIYISMLQFYFTSSLISQERKRL